MKKILEDMIIKWHQAGYSLDEIGRAEARTPDTYEDAVIRHQHNEARL